MEGFLVLIAVILVITPIITLIKLFIFSSSHKEDYHNLRSDLKALQRQMSERYQPASKSAPQETETETEISNLPVEPKAPPVRQKATLHDEIKLASRQEKKEEPSIAIPLGSQRSSTGHAESKPNDTAPKTRRNWEKAIGENILNKIGIAILVLGIGFLVKYSFNLIANEELANVAVGAMSGIILTFFSHRLRNSMKAFSSVLSGGGLAIFYFTTGIAFLEYEVLNQIQAFAIMVIITGFSVFQSVKYNRVELAIISILGGFITPLIVSTGTGSHVVLFTYLLILNAGMLALGFFKHWRVIRIMSFALTAIFMGSWIFDRMLVENAPHLEILLFAGAFYLLFTLETIVYQLKFSGQFRALDYALIVANNAITFGFSHVLLGYINAGSYQGLYTALLAIFNVSLSFYLLRQKSTSKNLTYLALGLALTFVSLIAPIQLKGSYITLFWASEAALLLWFGFKSRIQMVQWSSAIVFTLMLISLIMDWLNIYIGVGIELLPMKVILNEGFVTNVLCLLASGVLLLTLKRQHGTETQFFKIYRQGVQIWIGLLIYFTGLFEINYQTDQLILHSYAAKSIVVSIYNFVVLLTLYGLSLKRFPKLNLVALFSIGFAAIAYLGFYHDSVSAVRNLILIENASSWPYVLHYVMVGILLTVIAHLGHRLLKENWEPKWKNTGIWLGTVFLVATVSAEYDHLALLLSYDDGESISALLHQARKAGYAISWGLVGFLLMLLGIRHGERMLRIASLSVFGAVLIKLFLFDVKHMPEGGRIVAFIGLGLVLLLVSFMYQKLKTIIFTDNNES